MSSGTPGGRLTTHVLDTATGRPAAGMRIELFRLGDGERRLLKVTMTNGDGRCDGPLLQAADLMLGQYELVFHVGDYLRVGGMQLPDPPFLDVVPLRFGVADAGQHYHVPLLVSPYAYSTYRGS
ncbi:MAG: hydroxyisourate hydrolase [Geminicoccaceae bacterium]|jgi:5-hydroxyisourate hydrolase